MSHFQVVVFSFVLFLLLLLAAFFSSAETALMSVNRYRLRHKARLKKAYAVRLLFLLKRPDRLLSAILIGSTFSNILASSMATLIAFHFWGDKGAFLAAIALTFIVLIFTEIAPKTIAALYSDRVSRWVVYPIQWVLKLFYPIVVLANSVTNGLLWLLRIRVTGQMIEPLSREELRSVVRDTTGKISRQYQNMLIGILDLNNLTVDDAMVPHHVVKGIDIEESWDSILKQLNELEQDWVPVYRDHINHLVGVLYVHDVLHLLLTDRPFNQEILQQLLHEPYFVPEGTSLNVQLAYFQKHQDKIAFVVDEYGEIKGSLTLNDILEEIVGDFTSSISLQKSAQLQSDGSYLVDGAMTIREFNRLTEWELPLHGPRTINGLIVEYLEALPRTQTAVLIAGYPIEIIDVQNNRVKIAKISTRLGQHHDAIE